MTTNNTATLPAGVAELSTEMLCLTKLADAVKKQKGAYGSWVTWASNAYNAGLRVAHFPSDVQEHEAKKLVRNTIASALFTQEQRKLFDMTREAAKSLPEAAKATRKRLQQDVGRYYSNAMGYLARIEEQNKAAPEGAASAEETRGAVRSLGTRISEQATKWHKQLIDKASPTSAEIEAAKLLAALIRVSDSMPK